MEVKSLSKYYKQLDEIEKDLESQAYKVIAEMQDQIVKLNTDNLLKGFTPMGRRLKPYKNTPYANKKHRQNPAPGLGNPDLNKSGKYHSNFYLTASNQEFKFFSSTTTQTGFDLSGHLEKEYGSENIYGLTVEDNKIANYQIILPELLTWIFSKLTV